MHELEVDERLIGGEPGCSGVVVALQHPVQDIRGVEGFPDRGRRVGPVAQHLAYPIGQLGREGRHLAFGESLHRGLQVRSEQHLPGEPRVRQHRGVQVVGVYVGLVDTDMAKFTDYPKSDPADVVRQVLDGIESDADEVLADEMTRDVRAQLGKPIRARSGGMSQADF